MTSHLDPSALLLGFSAPPDPASSIGFSRETTISAPLAEQPAHHLPNSGPLFILGKTGAGKGVSALIPYCLRAPVHSTILVLDVKGEISAVTAEHRRRLGARVHVIDPFGIATDSPSTLNPLDLIGDPRVSLSAADDAAMLADALVVENPRGERFWDAASKNAIAAACLLLAAHAPDEWKNHYAFQE
jgi:type IV secretory pathway TraG/TraD family ATPase VirD4